MIGCVCLSPTPNTIVSRHTGQAIDDCVGSWRQAVSVFAMASCLLSVHRFLKNLLIDGPRENKIERNLSGEYYAWVPTSRIIVLCPIYSRRLFPFVNVGNRLDRERRDQSNLMDSRYKFPMLCSCPVLLSIGSSRLNRLFLYFLRD